MGICLTKDKFEIDFFRSSKMFILYEEVNVQMNHDKNYRFVYDLQNKIQIDIYDGEAHFSLLDKYIVLEGGNNFLDIDTDKICIRPSSDIEYVGLWIKGLSHEEIRKTLGRKE